MLKFSIFNIKYYVTVSLKRNFYWFSGFFFILDEYQLWRRGMGIQRNELRGLI